MARYKFVVSINLMRRHLNESQRGMIAARLAQLPQGRPSVERKGENLPLSAGQAADLLNVSTRTTKDARTVLSSGDNEKIAAVERGEVFVSLAATSTTRLPPSTPQTLNTPGI